MSLLLLLELDNIGLQVSASREGSRYITNQVGLRGSKLEKGLRLLEEGFLLETDLLVNFTQHVVGLLVLIF